MANIYTTRQSGSAPTVGYKINFSIVDVYYYLDIPSTFNGYFYSLTGGDMTIAHASHDITYESGEATTLFIPTTTSFAPINLSRGFADSASLHNLFALASSGNIFKARMNCSIVANIWKDGEYISVVVWNLENAWIQKISGFSYNSMRGSSTAKLGITIVAETILREDQDLTSFDFSPEPATTKDCNHCKSEIDINASTCPHCHKDQ